jgi:hypothetical protein
MDRTLKGFLAGIMGAIPLNIINLTCYYVFKIVEIRYVDWASIIMTGSKPNNTVDLIFSLIIQFCWTGLMGTFMAFLIPQVTSKACWIKSMIYSFLISFIFRGIVVIYQVPGLYKVPTLTSSINNTTGILWGLATMYILKKLDEKKIMDRKT